MAQTLLEQYRNKLRIDDLMLRGKRVLLRVDLNVPGTKGAEIADDIRIRKTVPTIQRLLDEQCRVIIATHWGRPDPDNTNDRSRFSTRPLASRLKLLLKFSCPVSHVDGCVGPKVEKRIAELKPGEVLVLENTRFVPGEREDPADPKHGAFSKQLANLTDVYINDAFATLHRNNASIVGVPKHLQQHSAIGLLVASELEQVPDLGGEESGKGVSILLGGGNRNLLEKLQIIGALLRKVKVDRILLGGAIANAFLSFRYPHSFGNYAKYADELERNGDELKLLQEIGSNEGELAQRVILPRDVIVGFPDDKDPRVERVDKLSLRNRTTEHGLEWEGAYDIGPETVNLFTKHLSEASTIIWNAPLGLFENDEYALGTSKIGEVIASRTGGVRVYLAGTDLNNACARLKSPFPGSVSTGGHSFLYLVAGLNLPGLDVLVDRNQGISHEIYDRLTVQEISVANRRVLLRVDFNVPTSGQGDVADDFRIQRSLPTIKYLLGQRARLILLTHWGNPEEYTENLSTKKFIPALLGLLEFRVKILHSEACSGPQAEAMVKDLRAGEILLLENTRFSPGERQKGKENDALARDFAQLGEIFVQDGFASLHREHASVTGIPKYLPSCTGLLVDEELKAFRKLRLCIAAPGRVLVLGGQGDRNVKFKIGIIDDLLRRKIVDKVLLGGQLANNLLFNLGYRGLEESAGGEPLHIQKQNQLRQLIEEFKDCILFPADFWVALGKNGPKQSDPMDLEQLRQKREAVSEINIVYDIGPRTVERFRQELANAGTIIWNAPLGRCEDPAFAQGTETVGRAIQEAASRGTILVLAGANLSHALGRLEASPSAVHFFSGTRAFLTLMAARHLEGLRVLKSRAEALDLPELAKWKPLAPEIFKEAGYEVHNTEGGLNVLRFAEGKARETLFIRWIHDTISANDLHRLADQLPVSDVTGGSAIGIIVGDAPPSPLIYMNCHAIYSNQRKTVVPFGASEMPRGKAQLDKTLWARRLTIEDLSHSYDQRQPIIDPGDFFGRTDLLSLLRQHIDRCELVTLHGLRRIGKTSVVYSLQGDPPSGVFLSYQDCRGCLVLNDLARDMVRQLQSSFGGIRFDTATLGQERPLLLQAIADILQSLGQQRINKLVFVFDELESLRNMSENDRRAFYGLLRELYHSTRGRVGAILISQDSVLAWDRIAVEVLSGVIHQVPVRFMNSTDTYDMVSGIGSRMGITYAHEALESIFALSGGHPLLARMICHQLVEILRGGAGMQEVVNSERVEEAARKFVDEVEGRENYINQTIWLSALNKEERQVLRKITQGLNIQIDTFFDHNAVSRLQELELITRDSDLQFHSRIKIIDYLIRSGALQE